MTQTRTTSWCVNSQTPDSDGACEQPVDPFGRRGTPFGSGGRRPRRHLTIGPPLPETLARQHAPRKLGHRQPTAVLGVGNHQRIGAPRGLDRRDGGARSGRVGVAVVEDQLLEAGGDGEPGALGADQHVPPTAPRLSRRNAVGDPAVHRPRIRPRRVHGTGLRRRAHLAQQLPVGFVAAEDRAAPPPWAARIRVRRPGRAATGPPARASRRGFAPLAHRLGRDRGDDRLAPQLVRQPAPAPMISPIQRLKAGERDEPWAR